MFVLLVSLMGPAANAAGGKVAEFKFDNSLKNSVGKSPIKMSRLGPCACYFAPDDVDGAWKTALLFWEGDGLKVTRIPKPNRKVYSVEMFFELNDLGGYVRLMSFGPNKPDKALYLLNGVVDLYPVEQGIDAIGVSDWVHVLISRTKKGVIRVFMDGVKQITFKDAASQYTLKKGQIVFFKDDDFEDAAGTVSNIRIYNRVITP